MGTKLKVTPGMNSVSHAGHQYRPDKHGVITVDSPEAVAVLTAAPFKFTVATIDDEDDEPAAEFDFEGMTKVELVDFLVARDVEIPKGKVRKEALIEMATEWVEENISGGSDDSDEDGDSDEDDEE